MTCRYRRVAFVDEGTARLRDAPAGLTGADPDAPSWQPLDGVLLPDHTESARTARPLSGL
jgi:hypothetical protein